LSGCHPEPEAKDMALASRILRCDQNDTHQLFGDRLLELSVFLNRR
jgi:hypothetical protein